MGQTSISIRVDNSLKQSFDSLCEQVGLSTTAAFTVFMKAAVRERRIPFELKAETIRKSHEGCIYAASCPCPARRERLNQQHHAENEEFVALED